MEKVYYGHIIEAEYLKEMLEEEKIGTMLRNEFAESGLAGYMAGQPGYASLYVSDEHVEQAKTIITNLTKNKE
ncbi:MAG: DUF2007 domain-containing protein [Bacteroidaceae bacterium]